jgi:putative tryptophan/tyrosine transport system substrate-binding protein
MQLLVFGDIGCGGLYEHLAGSSNGALIVTASMLAMIHRELITTLAARNKLSAVYSTRFWITGRGLIS